MLTQKTINQETEWSEKVSEENSKIEASNGRNQFRNLTKHNSGFWFDQRDAQKTWSNNTEESMVRCNSVFFAISPNLKKDSLLKDNQCSNMSRRVISVYLKEIVMICVYNFRTV